MVRKGRKGGGRARVKKRWEKGERKKKLILTHSKWTHIPYL